MPGLLPGTLLLEGVSGVVEEVPGVEEHEGENMEDLDIIRHDIQPGRMQPGLQPGREPGSAARSTSGLQSPRPGCSPAENRGQAARESRPRTFAIFRECRPRTYAIFRESAAGLQSIINKIITS
ncbi:unnamed protein product [Boreogadus saida]